MSFQFSPETIVIQFEEEIREQQARLEANESLAEMIKPLLEEKSTLTPSSKTTICTGGHSHWHT